jgi:Transposase IS116/IS110/IS902 family
VSALRHEDFLVLLPVKPLTLATDREAVPPSRAQDAPTDADLPGERRLHHRDPLTPLTPHSPTMRAWAPLVESRRRRVGDKVRLTNRLPRARQNDFPHVRQWLDAQDTPLFCALLSRWPTLKAAQRARRSTLEAFCRAPHGRSADLIASRRQALKSASALTSAAGSVTPHALLGQALGAQRRVTLRVRADFEKAIAQPAPGPPAFPLFDAGPGAGAVCAPRRLGAVGEHRERYPSADARQNYAGSAPGTERSGKKSWVHWRLQGPKVLRQPFVAWAAESIRHACWAQVESQQQRAKGKAPHVAVRALAFKWMRILYRGWQARTPYDESVYLQALQRRSAPLLHRLAQGA